jgi:hypothetical protein
MAFESRRVRVPWYVEVPKCGVAASVAVAPHLAPVHPTDDPIGTIDKPACKWFTWHGKPGCKFFSWGDEGVVARLNCGAGWGASAAFVRDEIVRRRNDPDYRTADVFIAPEDLQTLEDQLQAQLAAIRTARGGPQNPGLVDP